MKSYQLLKSVVLIAVLVGLFPQPAAAYVGPGVGMSAIGVFFAIIATIVVAVFGFLWYPIKRLLRMFKKRSDDQKDNDRKDEGAE